MDSMNLSDGPVIGVTGPDKKGTVAWVFTQLAVGRAGGKAVRITPNNPLEVDRLDGLVIGGGADVDPSIYEEERILTLGDLRSQQRMTPRYWLDWIIYPLLVLLRKLMHHAQGFSEDEARDKLELNLIQGALHKGIPILGICRGAQLLNVYFGGSLHQQLTGFYTETPWIRSVFPAKQVEIYADTKLDSILGRRYCRVNALHRQAVKRLGQGIRISAREASGVVQGIEHRSHPFVIGVQWHPEFLPQKPEQQKLFETLVRIAGDGAR